MDANPPKTSETTPDDNLSPGRVEFWLQLGHDKHRAELIASCSPEYWEHYRGLSHADARVEAARIIDARRHLLPHSWPGQSRILRTDPMHWYFEATATVRHRSPPAEQRLAIWEESIPKAIEAVHTKPSDQELIKRRPDPPDEEPLAHLSLGFIQFLLDRHPQQRHDAKQRMFRSRHQRKQASTPLRAGDLLADGAVYHSGPYLAHQNALDYCCDDVSGPRWGPLFLQNQPHAFAPYAVVGSSRYDRAIILKTLMCSVSHDRWVVYTDNTDLYSHVAGTRLTDEIHIFHHCDARTVAWDIAKDVASPEDAARIAESLVPHQQGRNPDFTAAIRALVAAAMKALHSKAPGEWTFLDLLAALELDNIEIVLSEYGSTRKVYDVHVRRNQGASSYLLSTLAATLEPFKPIAAAWHRADKKLSIAEWLKSDGVLILGNDNRHREAVTIINRVLFQLISEGLLAQQPQRERTTWLFLDGLEQLGTLKRIRRLMNEGTDLGITPVLGFHDVDKLRMLYDGDATKSLLGMCANYAFLHTDNSATAQWASDVIGYQEVFQDQTSRHYVGNEQQPHSITLSENRVRRPVVPAGSFQDLPAMGEKGLVGYFKTAATPPYFGYLDMQRLTRWGLVGDGGEFLQDSTEQANEEFGFPEDTAGLLSRLGFPCSASIESDKQLTVQSPDTTAPEQAADDADDFDPDDFPRFDI